MDLRGALHRRRFWILAGLALALLCFQAFHLYTLIRLTRHPGLSDTGIELGQMGGAMTVASVSSRRPDGGEYPARAAGLERGDRILAMASQTGPWKWIGGRFDWAAARQSIDLRKSWRILVARTGEGNRVERLSLEVAGLGGGRLARPLPWGGFILVVLLPLVCVGAGLFIGLMKLGDPKAFLAALLFFSFANARPAPFYTLLPPGIRELDLVLAVLLFSSWSYLFMRFFLVFPAESPLERRLPWLKTLLVAFPLVFTLWNIVWAYAEGLSFAWFNWLDARAGWLDVVLDVIFILLFAVGFLSLVTNIRSAASGDDRRRSLILLVGSLGIVPAMIVYFNRVVLRTPSPEWFYWIAGGAVGLFPLCFAYAVVKHRVLGIRVFLRRGLQYALLSRGFLFVEGAVLFLLLFYAAGPLLDRFLGNASVGTLALVTALMTMMFVLGLKHVNREVMKAMDRRFFREAYDGERILSELGRGLEKLARDPEGLARLISSKIMESLHPRRIGIFLRRSEILRLPISRETRRMVTAGQEDGGDFVCLELVSRSNGSGRQRPVGSLLPGFAVPAGSLVVRRMEDSLSAPPQAQDVYLDDPKSWAAELVSGSTSGHIRQLERAVLEALDTRLGIPLVAQDRLLGFLSLGEKRSGEPFSGKDKRMLLSVAQQMALALVYSGFIFEEAERLKFRHDVEIARLVQERLFPQQHPCPPGLQYHGVCRPARAVGGDCFDFIDLGPERLGLAVGDVSGKGVSAALLMASLQAMLRIHADAHGKEVDRLTADLNRLLCEVTDSNRFISLFYGVYDALSRTLTYVNAGHNPPILLRTASGRSLGAEAAHKRNQSGRPCRIRRLTPTAMVLGVVPDARFEKATLRVHRGDVLAIFTDGITEAAGPDGSEYGEARLQRILAENMTRTPEALTDAVFADMEAFGAGASQTDDITLLVAKFS